MLVFLKLGGSLITNKRQAEMPRLDVIERLAKEIATARCNNPELKVLIGNGAGSFGHVPARKYRTRDGVATTEEWFGYAETADAAARLNRLIIAALLQAGVPAWTLQPSAMVACTDGKISTGSAQPVARALLNGLVPVVHGDVALDSIRGGTIISTEEIFEWLARELPLSLAATDLAVNNTVANEPIAVNEHRLQRLILAGEVEGIYTADPLLEPNAELIPSITPETLSDVIGSLGDSHGVDVTGGMIAKVQQAFEMIAQTPGMEVTICSGLIEGNILRALEYECSSGVDVSQSKRHAGTRIYELNAIMN